MSNLLRKFFRESLFTTIILQLEFAQCPRQGAVKQGTLQIGNLPMTPYEILESYCVLRARKIDCYCNCAFISRSAGANKEENARRGIVITA